MSVLLVLSIAEGNVVEDGCLELSDLPLEDAKVFVGNIENLGCTLIQADGLSVVASLEGDLGLLLGSVHLALDLIELRLQSLLLLVGDGGGLGSLSWLSHLGRSFNFLLLFWLLGRWDRNAIVLADISNGIVNTLADLLEFLLLISQLCLALGKFLSSLAGLILLGLGFAEKLTFLGLKSSDLCRNVLGGVSRLPNGFLSLLDLLELIVVRGLLLPPIVGLLLLG